MHHPLFLIALLPDQEVRQEVTSFKQVCAKRFNARHAFKSPPHITLIPPFRWDTQNLEPLKLALMDFAYDQLSFTIRLNGFGSFPPRVVFVEVERNESLYELQRDLLRHLQQAIGFRDKNAQLFRPHMTIANRDLEETQFPAAWDYFSKQKYEQQFLAGQLTLLRHINKQWEVLEEFGFG